MARKAREAELEAKAAKETAHQLEAQVKALQQRTPRTGGDAPAPTAVKGEASPRASKGKATGGMGAAAPPAGGKAVEGAAGSAEVRASAVSEEVQKEHANQDRTDVLRDGPFADCRCCGVAAVLPLSSPARDHVLAVDRPLCCR